MPRYVVGKVIGTSKLPSFSVKLEVGMCKLGVGSYIELSTPKPIEIKRLRCT